MTTSICARSATMSGLRRAITCPVMPWPALMPSPSVTSSLSPVAARATSSSPVSLATRTARASAPSVSFSVISVVRNNVLSARSERAAAAVVVISCHHRAAVSPASCATRSAATADLVVATSWHVEVSHRVRALGTAR